MFTTSSITREEVRNPALQGKEVQAVPFSKPVAEQGARPCCTRTRSLYPLSAVLSDWNAEMKYSVNGVYSKADKAVVFNLQEAEEYSRRINRYE